MKIYSVSSAREQLYKLIDQVADAYQPICIVGKRNAVIMLSEESFNAMYETIYLSSVPGMKDSILHGMNEPLEQCTHDLIW